MCIITILNVPKICQMRLPVKLTKMLPTSRQKGAGKAIKYLVVSVVVLKKAIKKKQKKKH